MLEIVLDRLGKWTMSKRKKLSPKSIKPKISFERTLYDIKLENLSASSTTVEASRGGDTASVLHQAATPSALTSVSTVPLTSMIVPNMQFTHGAVASSSANMVQVAESMRTSNHLLQVKDSSKDRQVSQERHSSYT